MTRVWIVTLVALMAAACGGSSAAGDGATSGAAGSSAASGAAGSAGSGGEGAGLAGSAGSGASFGQAGAGTSGTSGSAGRGGCGLCPASQCSPSAIELQVTAPGKGGGKDGVIGLLSVKASGVTLSCRRSGCGFVCTNQGALPDGKYSVELSATGYQSTTLHIDVNNPTSCGCCACCPFTTNLEVSLIPNGGAIPGCCSDLMGDPNNCGACGNICAAGASCAAGKCTAVFSPCVTAAGDASCADYCQMQGQACAAACGPSGTESLHWWGQGSANCTDNLYSSNGTCAQSLAGFSGARCCCIN